MTFPQFPQNTQNSQSAYQAPQTSTPAPPEQQNAGPTPVNAGLSDFFGQAGGRPKWGASLSFDQAGIGFAYTVQVAQDISDVDVAHDSDMNGVLKYFKDGSPQLILFVNVFTEPGATKPDGTAYEENKAVLAIRYNDRADLAAAQKAAGVEPGWPKAGDFIFKKFVGTKKVKVGSNTFNKKLYEWAYQRPAGTEAPTANAQVAEQVAAYPEPTSDAAPTVAMPANLTPQQQAAFQAVLNSAKG